MSALRTFRVLRALKTISVIPGKTVQVFVFAGGRVPGLMLGVVLFHSLSPLPLPSSFSSHWLDRRSLSHHGVPSWSSMVVMVSCSCAYMRACVWCYRVCCVSWGSVLCHPTLLQIYNRVCGPWECLGAENVQGSPSIKNDFCHSR